ncbi:MAG: voltage-gated chloride channel family protein [Oscillatoriophycideae cyanobacterium NC_groundwater_1537_Pr4_S-0.65um_50_18]|nr:voltage-gated chloride channel family protein [Oscillatoriophycideae cyanobacterium NC_groundwater_1537_Pr4_S-0.65um_50_18]
MSLRNIEQILALPQTAKWLAIATLVGILTGTASAVLLAALEWATDWRETHLWIIALLPLGGLLSGLIYHHWGKSVEAGNNLLLEEIHHPQQVIPLRMAPLVLLGTVIAHLFGGSAGREGTALQMGASLADQLTRLLQLKNSDRRILLMAGISGGFASVFGTPLAGAVFGLEVLSIGKIRYDGLFPCVVAAIVGDYVILKWGLHHTSYQLGSIPSISMADFSSGSAALLSAIFAGAIFGWVALLFATATHTIGHFFKSKIAYPPFRPMVGGVMVAIAVWAVGTTKYIGLGIPTIVDAFNTQLNPWDFAAKLGFTALTLGAGFKGGEVTPLFYIGATLGNALSLILPLPTSLLAGMGFVAVFGAAANTPLASTLMAIELFGLPAGAFAGLACVVSYLFSGHAGIYRSQRIGLGKYSRVLVEKGVSLAMFPGLRRNPEAGLLANTDPLPPPKAEPENEAIPPLTTLRLYWSSGEPPDRPYRSAPQLATELLRLAKEFGIGYVLHQVDWETGDREPQCLELIDQEAKLRDFVTAYRDEFQQVNFVLLRGEPL